ncbi:MAG: bifunctional 5,10-methylenetetrahydrofolate dehydrogenase/5,10-methenyltetrahydrofolate cyclohydrolase [bacterium]|nr:bifunctional 5,10-methylenetetrahydrofolate dehydrogenase/5,10-methenyltetrahydrofolate cyclohydrolase [bacterium]
MARILDGKKLSERILLAVAQEIKNRKLKLKLAVVFVGEDKVGKTYLRKKREACEKAGIGFQALGFPGNISKAEFKKEIEKIVRDRANSGVVIQLPLPFDRATTQSFLNLIPPAKDPDCLGEKRLEKFSKGSNQVLPPVVAAIAKFFKEYKIRAKGKNAVVVGQGRLVGLPVSIWLKQQGAKVVVCDRKTKNIAGKLKKADIIISGAGSPRLIKGSMVKRGATVVDCGTSVESGRTCGDVDFKSVSKKAGFISPVPGGVGPLAVACLLENLVKISQIQRN